jgi:hypothetical protein
MSLSSAVTDLATRVANEFNTVRAEVESAAELVQQDAADPGKTIFVQFTGDPNPTGMARGDIRIIQT